VRALFDVPKKLLVLALVATIVCYVGRTLLLAQELGHERLGLAATITGIALFCVACGMYARGRGFSIAYGAIGLLNWIGLLGLGPLLDHLEHRRSPRS
jgi:hypothetical protein